MERLLRARNGDAISETKGWHGSSVANWIYLKREIMTYGEVVSANMASTGLLRAVEGSIFSYNGYGRLMKGYGSVGEKGPAYFDQLHYSRAVIVQGEGI